MRGPDFEARTRAPEQAPSPLNMPTPRQVRLRNGGQFADGVFELCVFVVGVEDGCADSEVIGAYVKPLRCRSDRDVATGDLPADQISTRTIRPLRVNVTRRNGCVTDYLPKHPSQHGDFSSYRIHEGMVSAEAVADGERPCVGMKSALQP